MARRRKRKTRAFGSPTFEHQSRATQAIQGIDYYAAKARILMQSRQCGGAHAALVNLKIFVGAMRAESAASGGIREGREAEDLAASISLEFADACRILPRE